MLKIFIQNFNEVDFRFLMERKTLQPEMSSYKKKEKKRTIKSTFLYTLVVKRVKIHWQYGGLCT